MRIVFQVTTLGHTLAFTIGPSEPEPQDPEQESSHELHDSEIGMYPIQAQPTTGFAWNPSVHPGPWDRRIPHKANPPTPTPKTQTNKTQS